MDLEATVVERLQKLREWQIEQQERLLKQQQMQRDMLTQRQDCIYKALELSIQELDFNDMKDTNNSNEDIASNAVNEKNLHASHNGLQIRSNSMQMANGRESCVPKQNVTNFGNAISQQQSITEQMIDDMINTESHMKNQSKGMTISKVENEVQFTLTTPAKHELQKEFVIDGVTPLPPDKTPRGRLCLDDIPIPSPRKDFHTLLEERLKDCETQSLEKSNVNPGAKVKRPFLRKGEGLSRFKLNQHSQKSASKVRSRSRSASFTNSIQSDSKCTKTENRVNKTTQSSKNTQLTRSMTGRSAAQKQLCLKNIPLPKKKVRSKSESNTLSADEKDYINEIKNAPELNTSDFHSRREKELEEVRIFELLEERAENSSFCSTSSAVVAFLQQSTPFKMKSGQYQTENGMLHINKVAPMIKTSKEQSIMKSNQVHKYTTSSKNVDACNDLPHIINKKIIENNVRKSTILQDINENNTMNLNENKLTILRNELHDEHNFCNVGAENDSEVDVSLHVRFSEYNEYKTIGLTDTSTMSTESTITKNFCDDKVWSECSSSETSTIETMPFEMQEPLVITDGKVKNIKHKLQFKQSNEHRDLNYKSQCSENMRHSKDSSCNMKIYEDVRYRDESDVSDVTYQSPDEEESVLHHYNQNDLTLEKTENCVHSDISRKHAEKSDNKKAVPCVKSYNGAVNREQENKENLDALNETVFKSELLKNRLLELEQEINIFRRENMALSLQRKKLQEDHKNLHKEYSEKGKTLEEQKKQAEDRLQEERKKLAREKAALENRLRDSQEKAQQSKLERQEIQILRQEIEKLREDMHTKESRWNAAQSRHKCQMRILKMENSKLKQEIERLQSLKKNVRNKGKPGTSSNTRAIHQINKQLNMQLKDSQKPNAASSDEDQKVIEIRGMNTINYHDMEGDKEPNYSTNKGEKIQKPEVDVIKKRNLYEYLIKEATLDLSEMPEQSVKITDNLNELQPVVNTKSKKLDSSQSIMVDVPDKSYKLADVPSNHNANDTISSHVQNDYTHFISPTKVHQANHERGLASTSEETHDAAAEDTSSFGQSKTPSDKQGVKQIQHVDGSIEYRFPNGNIKKVFPDRGITRLIYYNGDVRETNKDGRIKYFYSSTRTWHTTMPDGLEILEFADGQVEKRSNNGAVEVSFPDGSVRILEPDGIEKWSLPDGTLIQILTNGEKILTLPNGQREIHTKTHKRREYPDGTIKVIHLDGTQETRYSNGRVRLKDKDGNLLMDSYQQIQ